MDVSGIGTVAVPTHVPAIGLSAAADEDLEAVELGFAFGEL